jgi:hypothetical protein
MKFRLLLWLLIPALLPAQAGFNVTGRVSLRALNTDYDQKSEIKPDSVADSLYAKGAVIPGLQQSLNLALFARTSSVDMTLLGDIRNNPWNKINELCNLNRLSFSARFGRNEIALGDFFESGSELFIQSREVRGAKAHFVLDQLWNYDAFLETRLLAGLVQNAYNKGDRLRDLYRQYENAGQYRRYIGSAAVNLGETNRYQVGLQYLFGKDDEKSISGSYNEALSNHNAGVNGMLYLLERRLQFFGEGYFSRKDTLQSGGVNDYAGKGGFDLRLHNFKWTAFYQRLGYDYYSIGYPFLQNDRQGYKVSLAWQQPKAITLFLDGEQFSDNLKDEQQLPTIKTRIGEAGFTTNFLRWPELTLKWRFRDDNSNVIYDSVKTDKISRAYEGRLSWALGGSASLSLSGMFIQLDDHSVMQAGQPLGTEQFISSLNIYASPFSNFFISGGGVYSTLKLTNNQKNKNLYVYESSRWDIITQLLKLETTVSYIQNDAANGGVQDMLSDYGQLAGELSLEVFISSNLSLKAVGGADQRKMRYAAATALNIIADPDYGPTYFNSFETYDAMRYGLEINWIF